MKLDKVQMGVISYVHEEIASKLQGWHKFAAYGLTALATIQGEKVAVQLLNHPMAAAFGVVGSDGDINISLLEECMDFAMAQSKEVNVNGLIFKQDDIKKLFEHIKKQS